MPDIHFDRIVLGDLVTADRVLERGWIGILGETIAAIGQGAVPAGAEVLDFTGRLVLPGLVDGHMHTSRPSAGQASSTRAAAPRRAA